MLALHSPKLDRLDDGADSLPAEYYRDGTEAGPAGLGLMKLAPTHCGPTLCLDQRELTTSLSPNQTLALRDTHVLLYL